MAPMRAPSPREIRKWREACGLTIRQAADEVGCDTKTWWAWEQAVGSPNRTTPRGAILKSLLRVLKMTPSDFRE